MKALNLPYLDASMLISDDVSEKDLKQLATPFMLNAALPSAFLTALQLPQHTAIKTVKVRQLRILKALLLCIIHGDI